MRFELESQESVYCWSLPSGLASYAKQYMYLHIAEKELKDKILLTNPVPVNQEFSLKRNDVILKDF